MHNSHPIYYRCRNCATNRLVFLVGDEVGCSIHSRNSLQGINKVYQILLTYWEAGTIYIYIYKYQSLAACCGDLSCQTLSKEEREWRRSKVMLVATQFKLKIEISNLPFYFVWLTHSSRSMGTDIPQELPCFLE